MVLPDAARRLARDSGSMMGGVVNTSVLASDIGKGLFAGLVGTVAITVSQMVDMKLRGRSASTAPADAASKALGVEPKGDAEKLRFSQIVHFGYGTAWGAARGVIGASGLRGTPAMLAHFALVYGTALIMLPALDVSPPVTEWGASEIAIDVWHHLVYAAAVNAAYERLGEE